MSARRKKRFVKELKRKRRFLAAMQAVEVPEGWHVHATERDYGHLAIMAIQTPGYEGRKALSFRVGRCLMDDAGMKERAEFMRDMLVKVLSTGSPALGPSSRE